MKEKFLTIGEEVCLKCEPKTEKYQITRIQFVPEFGNVITIMDIKGNLYTVHIDDIAR